MAWLLPGCGSTQEKDRRETRARRLAALADGVLDGPGEVRSRSALKSMPCDRDMDG